MLKHYLFGLLLLSTPLFSQHCPFDGAYILVVEVEDSLSGERIPDLKISFLDSLGERITHQVYRKGGWEDDTLWMWMNPDSTSHCGIIDNNHPMNPWSIRFWFAESNYVLVWGADLPGSQILIEDLDGSQNGGQFKTRIVALGTENLYPLCTGHSNWDYGPEGGFVEGFQSLKVYLSTQ